MKIDILEEIIQNRSGLQENIILFHMKKLSFAANNINDKSCEQARQREDSGIRGRLIELGAYKKKVGSVVNIPLKILKNRKLVCFHATP